MSSHHYNLQIFYKSTHNTNAFGLFIWNIFIYNRITTFEKLRKNLWNINIGCPDQNGINFEIKEMKEGIQK